MGISIFIQCWKPVPHALTKHFLRSSEHIWMTSRKDTHNTFNESVRNSRSVHEPLTYFDICPETGETNASCQLECHSMMENDLIGRYKDNVG